MSWKLQTLLWKFLPEDRAINLSLVLFGSLLALSALIIVAGWFLRRRGMCRLAVGLAAAVCIAWGVTA